MPKMTIYKIYKDNSDKVEIVDLAECINRTEVKGFYKPGTVKNILETVGMVETPWVIFTTKHP